jgi:aminodeoxychorismate lyase
MSHPQFPAAVYHDSRPALISGALTLPQNSNIVFLNGQFVTGEQAVVSIFDRGFLYGDGLFESVLISGGRPFRWRAHFERFERGADFLRIKLPFPADRMRGFAEELIARNGASSALLRLTLSRGTGPRGYSPRGADQPALAISLHPVQDCDPVQPVGWKLHTASFRLPAGEALAQFKTCNKLAQVLARAEAENAGADEALLLNTQGNIVEASSANLFWIQQQTVCTAPLAGGVLAGVTRSVVEEICEGAGIPFELCSVTPGQLRESHGVFLSLSTLGIVEGLSLDAKPLARSPLVSQISTAYWKLVRSESGLPA